MTRLAERLVALPYRRFCGRMVQGFRIGSVMGIGGSGVVFSALDPDGDPVILKLLRPLRASYDLAAVWREVEPFGRVGHPAVPAWLGIVREGRAYFIVMSHMPGESLAHWLFEQRHPFEREEFVRIGSQLADALVCLHAAGVAHGDLRPANILYDGKRVSLVDFGMSCLVDEGLEVFGEAKAIDIAGFADIVLYLLYSTYQTSYDENPIKTSRPNDPVEQKDRAAFAGSSWRDELTLSCKQRQFLEDVLVRARSMEMDAVRIRFLEVFG